MYSYNTIKLSALVPAYGWSRRANSFKTVLLALFFAVPAVVTKAQSFSEAIKNSTDQQKGDTVVIVQPDKYINQASTYFNQATLQTITIAYGCSIHRFNKVVAIGPALMTSFNDSPAVKKEDNEIGDQQALNQFVASLDESQWRQFTSLQGIGVTDLHSPEQAKLFYYFLRPGITKTVLNYAPREDLTIEERLHGVYEMAKDPFLSNDDINATRLRLGIKNEIDLPVKGRINGYMDIGVAATPSDPYSPYYQLVHGSADLSNNEVSPFYDMPNSPKQSDLDYKQSDFTKPVDLSECKNLKQVFDTINSSLSPEERKISFYPHPAYQNKTFTVYGNKSPVISDLLQAVAYSVTGTYRAVGDVVCLTNDTTGAAQHYYKYKTQLDTLKSNDDINNLPGNTFTPAGLNDTWDSLPLSPQQRSYIYASNGLRESIEVPWEALNSAQSELVQRMTDKLTLYSHNKIVVDEKSKPRITVKPLLQALIPNLDAPADIVLNASVGKLFSGAAIAQQKALANNNSTVNNYSIKALHIPYQSIGSVDDVIQRASERGYNYLWIDISQQLPSLQKDSKEYIAVADLLKSAAKSAEPSGIQISLYADPFTAGSKTIKTDLDQSIIGLDKNHCNITAKEIKQHIDVIASLAAGAGKLNSLVIAVSDDSYGMSADPARNLGYTIKEREAFIRKMQVDPIDILPSDIDPEFKKLAVDYNPADNTNMQMAASKTNYAKEWKLFYAKDVDQAVAALCTELSAKNSAYPIYIRRTDHSINIQPYYTRWTKEGDNPSQKIIVETNPNQPANASQKNNVVGYVSEISS